jgi:hypothetical protein
MYYHQRKRGGKYSDEYITTLKEKVNFYEVVSRFVRLRKVNRRYAYGLCPLHNEKTPSFSFCEEWQFYHCFGCGAYGHCPIRFVAEMLRLKDKNNRDDDNPFCDIKPTRRYEVQAIIYLARMYSYWPSQHRKYKKRGRPG